MNPTSIEWCDFTWNPLTGCLHGCPYCYARRMAENPFYAKAFPHGFKPTFHAERLNEPCKEEKPASIFVCSMADLFGDWVHPDHIRQVLEIADWCQQHTYLFLTKNGLKMASFGRVQKLENGWFGQTSTGIPERPIIDIPNKRSFISLEPLLGGHIPYGKYPRLKFQQVIIGAQTGPKVAPERVWVEEAIERADDIGAKVFLKDNILEIYPDLPKRRELAWRIRGR
jgi:protein gp37